MPQLQLDAQEIATLAWFLESAIVSLKESLEEEDEVHGVEDALAARDLDALEGLRGTLQGALGAEGAPVELTGEQMHRLARLADDAARVCRGGKGERVMGPGPGDSSALAGAVEAVAGRVRAHPDYPGDPEE
jgi:hypothetical protein